MVFGQDNKSDCRHPDIRAAAIAQVSGTPHGVSVIYIQVICRHTGGADTA